MSDIQPVKTHVVIIDGPARSGKKTLGFELALALLYNNQKTALLLAGDSPLRQTLQKRRQLYPELLTPEILSRDTFYTAESSFDAVIIPDATAKDELAAAAATYITVIASQKAATLKKDTAYTNSLWELKKKIAAAHNRSLNWVVCPNSAEKQHLTQLPQTLKDFSRLHGFRISPALSFRAAYKNNSGGISSQDKTLPAFKNMLTYEDICAKREIIKLAEFIFSA